jgi:hypothetical protein
MRCTCGGLLKVIGVGFNRTIYECVRHVCEKRYEWREVGRDENNEAPKRRGYDSTRSA